MKEDKMNNILGVVLAAIIGTVTLGATNQAYAASNDITQEKFVASFADNYTGYYYKNITNMASSSPPLVTTMTGTTTRT
jgi:hypothetical protein